MYLGLGGGEVGGAALGGGGELGRLGLVPIDLRGEGGEALLEEGAGLLGRDGRRVGLGADGVDLVPELADGGVGPLGDRGHVPAEEPELLVGHEERHRRGRGGASASPSPAEISGWPPEGSRVSPRGGREGWWRCRNRRG